MKLWKCAGSGEGWRLRIENVLYSTELSMLSKEKLNLSKLTQDIMFHRIRDLNLKAKVERNARWNEGRGRFLTGARRGWVWELVPAMEPPTAPAPAPGLPPPKGSSGSHIWFSLLMCSCASWLVPDEKYVFDTCVLERQATISYLQQEELAEEPAAIGISPKMHILEFNSHCGAIKRWGLFRSD